MSEFASPTVSVAGALSRDLAANLSRLLDRLFRVAQIAVDPE